jgi:purine/pyrimidine-nucleoside phosphorylase
MNTLNQVSIVSEANIYFEGRCVSHTVLCADGSRKSVGVIFPALLTFNTSAAEVMELVKGSCRVKIAGQQQWCEYNAGEQFSVAAHSSFEIEVLEPLHYICHFS